MCSGVSYPEPYLFNASFINPDKLGTDTHRKVFNNIECFRNQVTLKASAGQLEVSPAFNLLLPSAYELRRHNTTSIQHDGRNYKTSSMKCFLFISAGKWAIQPVSLFVFITCWFTGKLKLQSKVIPHEEIQVVASRENWDSNCVQGTYSCISGWGCSKSLFPRSLL